jgi:hypothetical protein
MAATDDATTDQDINDEHNIDNELTKDTTAATPGDATSDQEVRWETLKYNVCEQSDTLFLKGASAVTLSQRWRRNMAWQCLAMLQVARAFG